MGKKVNFCGQFFYSFAFWSRSTGKSALTREQNCPKWFEGPSWLSPWERQQNCFHQWWYGLVTTCYSYVLCRSGMIWERIYDLSSRNWVGEGISGCYLLLAGRSVGFHRPIHAQRSLEERRIGRICRFSREGSYGSRNSFKTWTNYVRCIWISKHSFTWMI